MTTATLDTPPLSLEPAPEAGAPVLGTSPATEAMHNTKFRVAGDVVAAATKDLDDDSRTVIRWFAAYCRKRNLGPAEAGTLLLKEGSTEPYSWHTIYSVLTGRRAEQGASIEPVVKAMHVFRKKVEGQRRVGESGYIQTRMGTAIWDRCNKALKMKKIGFIFGDSQIGKTVNLVEYALAHNHGQTIYVEAPTGGSIAAFLNELG